MHRCVAVAAERVTMTSLPGTRTVSAPEFRPSAMVLLVETDDSAPRAVAWSRSLEPRPANAPTMVLLLPMVLKYPAECPTNVLLWPELFERPATRPKNEFCIPPVVLAPALSPKNELKFPVSLR